MALYILQKAYQSGTIKQGNIIVEATSGNTGIAFAAIGKALGHQVRIIMPDWLSTERQEIIRSCGAEVDLISKEDGGFLDWNRRKTSQEVLNSLTVGEFPNNLQKLRIAVREKLSQDIQNRQKTYTDFKEVLSVDELKEYNSMSAGNLNRTNSFWQNMNTML